MAPSLGRVHPGSLGFGPELRRIVYTTNLVESVHYQLRKVTKTRGHFPTDQSALKLLRLAAKKHNQQTRRKPQRRRPRLENSPKPTRNPLPQPTKPNPLKTHEPTPSHRQFDKPWKWSLCADRAGIPIGWATDGANRHDTTLFEPTLAQVAHRGLVSDIETLHLDRGYDTNRVRDCAGTYGIRDLNCGKKRPPGAAHTKTSIPLGQRWPIERTNSWLSNFGQLRRNTDRHPHHRLAQLALAIALLITAKLIDWRDRYNLNKPPIRAPSYHGARYFGRRHGPAYGA